MGARPSTCNNYDGAVIVATAYQGKTYFAERRQGWTDIDSMLKSENCTDDIVACQHLGNKLVTSHVSLNQFKPNVAVVCVPRDVFACFAPSDSLEYSYNLSQKVAREAKQKKVLVFTTFDDAAAHLESQIKIKQKNTTAAT